MSGCHESIRSFLRFICGWVAIGPNIGCTHGSDACHLPLREESFGAVSRCLPQGKEVYGPRGLLCQAIVCVVMQGMIQNFVRSTLSLTFVIAAAKVVFSIKGRMTRESSWQLELKGDLTRQRRVEAVDKLLSVLTLLVASVFGLQAIGLDGRFLTFRN